MKLRNSQKGFTLVEMLIVIAVGGLLLSGIVPATFQTIRVTTSSNTKITALEDIKNIPYRLGKDVRMAATTNLVEESPTVYDSLVLDWTSWYDETGELVPTYHQCLYTFLSEGKVQREYKKGDEPGALTTISTTTTGKYISDIEFSRQGHIIFVTITSSPEGKAETEEQKTYHIYLQPKMAEDVVK